MWKYIEIAHKKEKRKVQYTLSLKGNQTDLEVNFKLCSLIYVFSDIYCDYIKRDFGPQIEIKIKSQIHPSTESFQSITASLFLSCVSPPLGFSSSAF